MSATATSIPSNPASSAAPPGVSIAEIDASSRLSLVAMFSAGAFWLLVSSVLGLISSIKFHSPDFLSSSAWLTYGRVRPAFVDSLLYGFCLQVGLGVGLWLVARLGRTMLQPLPILAGAKLLNVGVALGVFGILHGDASGYDALNFPRYAAALIFGGYVLIGVPAVLAFHRRAVLPLFVSQWFLLAALFWFPWIYSTGSLLVVAFPLRGVAQPIVAWWYAANFQFVWMGLVGLAIAFYLVPKVTGRELVSHNLALFIFWTLILFGSWTGVPRTAAVPAYLPTISTVTSVLTILTLVAVALVVWKTVDGNLGLLWGSRSLRFVAVGLGCFLLAGLMNIADSLATTGSTTNFTWFTIARTHLLVYGFFAMILFGAVYFITPQLVGRELPFTKWVGVHFWLATLGILIGLLPLAMGGIVQGRKLLDTNVAFVDVAKSTLMFLRLSTVGDLLILAGHGLLLINLAMLGVRLTRVACDAFLSEATAEVQPEGVKS
jgi:cytochrome c oxidase cbb3-type subunit 1